MHAPGHKQVSLAGRGKKDSGYGLSGNSLQGQKGSDLSHLNVCTNICIRLSLPDTSRAAFDLQPVAEVAVEDVPWPASAPLPEWRR